MNKKRILFTLGESVWKIVSSVWSLNLRLLGYESSALTTRPQVLPSLINLYLMYNVYLFFQTLNDNARYS